MAENSGDAGLDGAADNFEEFGTYYSVGEPAGSDDNSGDTESEIGDDDVFAHRMWYIVDSNGNLLLDKHACYGPDNIGHAPGGPLNGLRVRMHDKLARLNHMLEHPGQDDLGESLYDTLADLSNYAIIGQMVLRGWWPNT